MIKKTLFLAFVTMLSGCGKNKVVTGRVYSPVNGEPVVGLPIELRRETINWNKGDKVIDVTTTNQDGSYFFEYKDNERVKSLLFQVNTDANYVAQSVSPGLHSNETYDLQVVPQCDIQKSYLNTNCFDESDVFQINSKIHRSLPNYYTYQNATYTGCMDQQFGVGKTPMGWHVWKGTVTRNGTTTNWIDSIYVQPGQLNSWDIEY